MKKNFLNVFLLVLLWSSVFFSSSSHANNISNNLFYAENGLALELPYTSYLRPVNSLSLTALIDLQNSSNPILESQSQDDFFNAKILLNPKQLFFIAGKNYQAQGKLHQAKLMQDIADATSSAVVMKLPAHQFNLGKKISNRIVFYGGKNELSDGPGHDDIDKLVHKVTMPMVKIMTHFDKAQGENIQLVFKEGNGGMTHAGGLYPGWSKGKPVSVRSEWPADYGTLDDEHIDYNAHLLAIDYQAATLEKIPDIVLKSYHNNFSLWDVFTGMMVPFALKSKFIGYKDYSNNPLEMIDTESMINLANVTSSMDNTKVRFTSYCSEGQWNVANLAVNLLIKKGQFSHFDQLISEFQSAPEYQNIAVNERSKYPEYGWDWLRKNNIISHAQYRNIINTNRYAVYLDWIADTIEPWARYQPNEKNDFIAQAMSLGSMIRMILRIYYPRENIARLLTDELINTYQTANDEVKQAITTLARNNPNTEQGKKILMASMMQLAGLELAYILHQEEVKQSIFNKLGYQYIISEQDKAQVESLYAEYINAIVDPKLKQRELFDKRLAELDHKLESMQVRMKVYGPTDTSKRNDEADTRFFMWVAPQSWVFWAKYPKQFYSSGIRYVATAMHYQQSKDYEAESD